MRNFKIDIKWIAIYLIKIKTPGLIPGVFAFEQEHLYDIVKLEWFFRRGCVILSIDCEREI